jgi:DNA-binding CsgD family transcriptional regulator
MTDQDKLSRRQREAQAADRRAEMWNLYVNGLTQVQIAKHFGITQPAVSQHLSKASRELPAQDIELHRAMVLDELDRLKRVANGIMTRRHIVVSGGKVVKVESDSGTMVPLQDDGPVLAAIKVLDQLMDRRCKILGLYAPTKVNIEARELKREISELVKGLCEIDENGNEE